MKIAFIRVNMFEHIGTDAMKPILFGIIRHLTPQRHEIVFLDERAEALPESLDADIIAFSVETYTAKRAYILAKRYRTERNIIVMGGFHASVCADEMLDYADSVLIGDAEDTWLDFLADCEQGRPQPKYTSHETAPLRELPETPGAGTTGSASVRSRVGANSTATSARSRPCTSACAANPRRTLLPSSGA